MYNYDLRQWLGFFFFYCLCGWIWESCYVSAKKRRWVNRGFLHGPLIPIYGFGALIILFVTLPIRENLAAVYFAGLVGATALEYVTGAVMERCFNVKYWDYSNQRFHINGYICLSSSIVWGIFSVLLIKYVHRPVEKLIFKIPMNILTVADIILVIWFAVDVIISVKEAFDLKALMAEEKEMMLALKLEVEQRRVMLTAELEQRKEAIASELEQRKDAITSGLEQRKDSIASELEQKKDAITSGLEQRKDSIASELGQKKDAITLELEQRRDAISAEIGQRREQFEAEMEQRKEMLMLKWEKKYKGAKMILKRNPDSTFQKGKILSGEIARFFEKKE